MQLRLSFGSEAFRFCVLGSGSSGNAVVVESGGRTLLIDAGFSCRELERRLGAVGVDPKSTAGIILTHEHGDHVRGAARFSRRFEIPVYATAGTLSGIRQPRFAPDPVVLRAGSAIEIGSFRLEPFTVSHDAREPIGLVVESEGGGRLGLAADLGIRSREAWSRLLDLDALILEANHDLEMLMKGPYPWPLKQRIAGDRGHLSNADAAAGIEELVNDRLEWVVLYHLSKVNNRQAIARDEVGETLARVGARARLRVSSQAKPSPWMDVGARVESLAS
ncbi:MAG: MBL fold metallo-hydrolase [Deltaproteobacteria bacterium]|nr:MBL fold metallo-hydrolase [Deltaproteobacteria bacterium]